MHDAAGRERGVLAVVDDRQTEHAGVLEGAAHEVRVGYGRAVVAEGDGARLGKLREVRQFAAGAAPGYAGDREDADSALRLRGAEDELDHAGGVDGWLGVGHGADGGEAAARRCERAGRDRLFVLEAGLAEMRVDVDEPGANNETTGIDGLARILPSSRAHFSDAAVGDEDVSDDVDVVGGVDYAAAADGKGRRHLAPLASRYSAAMRTATPLVTCSSITD